MTSITIRDLRQRWPEAESALESNDEILVTRDGKPVAKLVRYVAPNRRRPRFDFAKNMAQMKKDFGGRTLPDSVENLSKSRDRFGR